MSRSGDRLKPHAAMRSVIFGFLDEHFPEEVRGFDDWWEEAAWSEFRVQGGAVDPVRFAQVNPHPRVRDQVALSASTLLTHYYNLTEIVPSAAKVRKMVRICAQTLGADPPLVRLIANELAPRLHKSLIMLSEQQQHAALDAADTVDNTPRVWAEWCDRDYAEHEQPQIHRSFLANNEARARFEDNTDIRLCVDELAPGIRIRHAPGDNSELILWSKLRRQHCRFLGLALTSFATREPIPYTEILRVTRGQQTSSIFDLDREVRRLKSEVNKLLGGTINETLKGSRDRRYVVAGQIAYCWVLPSNKTSRLFESE